MLRADHAIDQAMIFADVGDLNQVITNGERAADGPDITGEYNFLFARALVLCADRLDRRSTVQGADLPRFAGARAQTIELAAARAQRSLAHTQTPDLNYLFLAYLALVTGDVPKLRAYADQAASWDPNHFRTRWMLAEAYLAIGDWNRAKQEAETALDINPTSSEAKSVLSRMRAETESPETQIEETIERAREKVEAGKPGKARKLLDRALRLSDAPCPECHRALALLHEAGNEYQNAIAEWEIFMGEAPERASAEQITSRIEALRRKR
jgi:tetratricopeptide (TPR) repeat protein